MPEITPLPGSSGLSTQRLLRAWEDRITKQIEDSGKRPRAYYAGGGKVEELGANNSYRPRGIQSNANLAVGDPIQLNDGLVSATPTSGGASLELQGDIESLDESLLSVATSIGPQFGKGSPNEQVDDEGQPFFIRPRRPFDVYHDLYTTRLWRWNTDAEEDAKWEILRDVVSELNGQIDSVEPGRYYALVAFSREDLRIVSTALSLLTLDGSEPLGNIDQEILITGLGANPAVESTNVRIIQQLGGEAILRKGGGLWLLAGPDAAGAWAFNIEFETVTDVYLADLAEAQGA